MPLIHLVNPNTSEATTAMMVATAQSVAPPGWVVAGLTARRGAPLIVDAAGLEVATDAVCDLRSDLNGDGVIVAAFGDPGADALRDKLAVPVIGIGEASIRAAGTDGRRFSVATTTPGLEASIRARVAALGFARQLASLRLTGADPVALTADPSALEESLFALVERCVAEDGAEAVIIGGGPLARAARAIAGMSRATIVEPVPAAVAWMSRALARSRA